MFNALKNIPRRAKKAMGYSCRGLAVAFRKEEAIKLEFISLLILLLVLGLVTWPFWKKLALVAAFFVIPLTELVNSAIEDVCDLVSPDYNEKIRDAKDKGSAAVLMAIVFSLTILGVLLATP
ncbi:MAG: diacylglycerol kinase [Deltaproteobacteria bacterium]|jgi:diacylglycerol kinase (ATP)|nr:diacylglycerol kinase [Deltaproteobacteria bacterium]